MGKRLSVVTIALTILFFSASICLAGEPATVIQFSMGLIWMGGAMLVGGSLWGLGKTRKRKKECTDGHTKKKDL